MPSRADIGDDGALGLLLTLSRHWNGNKTVSMKDGLPRFKDLLADYGGSGETLPE